MAESVDAVTAGGVAYVDDRMQDARSQWEAAFRDLRSAGRLAAAARAATLLGELHWGGLGNPSTGRGWLERAGRLLDEHGPCVERGYWELARLACDRPDPAEVEDSARRALVLADDYADAALRTRALADLGYALVCQGRLLAGFALLDEVLAMLTGGEVADPFVASTASCALLSACDRAGDVERAREWLRVIRECVLDPAAGRPRMLGAHCRIALGGVLCAVGDWAGAETEIGAALQVGSGATAAQRIEAGARLAEVHLQRGRLDDAARVLLPIEDQPAAAGPLAQLHLERAEPALAIAVADRAVGRLGSDVLRQAGLLLVTVRAGLHCGRPEVAAAAMGRLRAAADTTPAVRASADLAEGLIAAAGGDRVRAGELLDAARRGFEGANRPHLAAQAWLALAEVAPSEHEAVAAARAAHAIAVRLDAPMLRDRCAALLRVLGSAVPRSPGPQPVPVLTSREHEILQGLRRGDSNAQIAARLYLSPKTVEHHVSRVLAKLGVRNRAEAAAFAAGLPDQEPGR